MLGAYAFARMDFPGREGLFWMYLATLMVPNVVTMVPLYVMFAHSGMLNLGLGDLPAVRAWRADIVAPDAAGFTS